MTILHEELLRLLHYCPETGIFTNRVNRRKARAGTVAGTLHKCKLYKYVQVNKVDYRQHKLAWFYHYGVWPENELDHIDKDKMNNAIDNLREATRAENNSNKGIMKHNTSGYKGVSWSKKRNKWKCVISRDKKYIAVGFYTCPIEAARAYDSKALELHGVFAVTNASLGLI